MPLAQGWILIWDVPTKGMHDKIGCPCFGQKEECCGVHGVLDLLEVRDVTTLLALKASKKESPTMPVLGHCVHRLAVQQLSGAGSVRKDCNSSAVKCVGGPISSPWYDDLDSIL